MKVIKNSDGAVLIMVAMLLVALVGVTAFAVDFGVVFVTNKQLANAADAGALAGARALGYIRCVGSGNPDCTVVSGVSAMGSESIAVKSKVTAVVGDNSTFGTESLAIAESDIVLGKWINASQEFTSIGQTASDGVVVTEDNSNAVQTTVRKEGESENGAVQAFFGAIYNYSEYNTRREAIAALTGVSVVGPGELIPIAISTGKNCGTDIKFTGSTADSCAGWTDLSEDYKKAEVQAIIEDLSSAPGAKIGQAIEVNGGVTDSISKFYDLWLTKPHPWEVLVPVYASTCKSPDLSDPYPIVGFATMKITNVIPNGGDKGVYGTLACDKYEEAPGGGADFGTLGTIPGLVR
jgi:Putative Flp pilus-assembly TadE/G-like